MIAILDAMLTPMGLCILLMAFLLGGLFGHTMHANMERFARWSRRGEKHAFRDLM